VGVFGLTAGQEIELGCFPLQELKIVQGLLRLPTERELYNKLKTTREMMEEHQKEQNWD
jgi:hypothetical protein